MRKGTGRANDRKVRGPVAALWCLSLVGCAWTMPSRMITLDQSANGTEVSLSRGQQMELALPENPTTGFRWELLQTGAPVLAAEGSSFEAPQGAPGKGGIRRWRFHAARAGSGTLELAYRRSFEPAKPPSQTFLVHLRVAN